MIIKKRIAIQEAASAAEEVRQKLRTEATSDEDQRIARIESEKDKELNRQINPFTKKKGIPGFRREEVDTGALLRSQESERKHELDLKKLEAEKEIGNKQTEEIKVVMSQGFTELKSALIETSSSVKGFESEVKRIDVFSDRISAIEQNINALNEKISQSETVVPSSEEAVPSLEGPSSPQDAAAAAKAQIEADIASLAPPSLTEQQNFISSTTPITPMELPQIEEMIKTTINMISEKVEPDGLIANTLIVFFFDYIVEWKGGKITEELTNQNLDQLIGAEGLKVLTDFLDTFKDKDPIKELWNKIPGPPIVKTIFRKKINETVGDGNKLIQKIESIYGYISKWAPKEINDLVNNILSTIKGNEKTMILLNRFYIVIWHYFQYITSDSGRAKEELRKLRDEAKEKLDKQEAESKQAEEAGQTPEQVLEPRPEPEPGPESRYFWR